MLTMGCYRSDLTGVQCGIDIKGFDLPLSLDISRQVENPHDQGDKGICVSVSTTDTLKYLIGKDKYKKPLEYYYNKRANKKIDGMTPREALEIAVSDGDIKSYSLLRGLLEVRAALMINGPVIVCLPVYDFNESFWMFNGTGLIGYHALTCVGYDEDYLLLKNSWGTSWGRSGYVYMPVTQFGRFIELWTVFS